MNGEERTARRYHWLSEGLRSFVDEPHSAIEGQPRGVVCNLTDARAEAARKSQLELLREGPSRVVQTLRRLREGPNPVQQQALPLPHLQMPAHHEVHGSDLVLRRLHATLAAAAERAPVDFADLLTTPGLGARSVLALAMVAEVIHGAPFRFSDPARFSTALGGKDGHPFPVPLAVYDTTLGVLRRAVGRARLGNEDRMAAIRRLDQQARLLEATAQGPAFEEFVAAEWRQSREFGGRTVQGPAPEAPPAVETKTVRKRTPAPGQLELWGKRPGSQRSARGGKR
jgi:hypothetical protein